MTPGQAASALATLALPEVLGDVLKIQAEQLASQVRDSLGHPAGGPHDQPWKQSGSLADSIAVSADGLEARVGSSDPAAVPQEFGTTTVPPRPFLAPAAAVAAEKVAHAAGSTAAAAIKRLLT